jgi:hypothetical protein
LLIGEKVPEENGNQEYLDISYDALQILSAFFLEEPEGEDNDLMLQILTDNLGMDPEEADSFEEKIVAYQEMSMKLTSMFSGMLCHVVNMVRVLAMMSMRSDTQAYKSYVEYFNYLLPSFDSVETEDEMIEYLEKLHYYFGVEIPDETA